MSRRHEVVREAWEQLSHAQAILESYSDNVYWDAEIVRLAERIEKVANALDRYARRGDE